MTELTGSAPRAAGFPRADLRRRTLGVRRLTVADAAALVGVALAYAAVARVSLVFMAEPQHIAVIWPPAGIALGALLTVPTRRWPLLLVALAVAIAAAGMSVGHSPVVAAGYAAVSTGEAVLAAMALRRLRIRSLTSVHAIGWFFAVALGTPAVAALAGATVAAATLGAPFPTAWLTWFVADAAGIIAVAPVFLLRRQDLSLGSHAAWRRIVEATVLELAVVVLAAATFLAPVSGLRLSSYPIFLLLVLGALRFGVAGATILTVQVAAIVTAATVGGTGPIAALNPGFIWQVGQAHILVAVVFLTSFVTAAAVSERRRAEELVEAQRVAAAERAATSERLTAFAREIARTLEADATFHRIVHAATGVVDVDIVQLTVADETAAGKHFVRAAIGAPAAIGQPIETGDGIAGGVIRDGVAVAHELCDPSDHGRALTHALPPEPMAFACAPVMRDGTVIATLGLGRLDLARPFTATETGALGVMADLSALAIANVIEFMRADELSIRDELTGLPNRRYFTLALEQLAAVRARQAAEARPVVSAILMDVDHFGAVNNERGHETGDVVLAALGNLLAARLRRADIVARFGGEEFIAILPGTPRNEAVRVADEIRRQFAALVLSGTDGQPIRCTLSAGVAAVPAGQESTAELIGTADVALIMAKRAGRNQVIAA